MIGNLTHLRGLALISLYAALLSVAACKRHADNPSALFPVSNEVAGWVRTGEIRTFSAADLWKYIDGEVERYLKAGVQTTSTADYRFQGKSDAVVDVYTMGNPAGAEKILEAEPAADAQTVRVGDNGRLFGQSLVFRKGPYLVRVTAYEESAQLRQALVALGHAIEQRLTR
jgi:hypothetical protein